MNHSNIFWDNALRNAGLPGEPGPGLPVVEIMGAKRVLIENHFGVVGYDQKGVCIKVKYGAVRISGSNLCLTRMSKHQIIICGNIDDVSLIKG